MFENLSPETNRMIFAAIMFTLGLICGAIVTCMMVIKVGGGTRKGIPTLKRLDTGEGLVPYRGSSAMIEQ
jgi:uncharacterized membrane protein YciS (DUF1049 family)